VLTVKALHLANRKFKQGVSVRQIHYQSDYTHPCSLKRHLKVLPGDDGSDMVANI
jgi:hypothetical protein